jgi:hypothetical protein
MDEAQDTINSMGIIHKAFDLMESQPFIKDSVIRIKQFTTMYNEELKTQEFPRNNPLSYK